MDAKILSMIAEIDRGGLEYVLAEAGHSFPYALHTGALRIAVEDLYYRGQIPDENIHAAWETTPGVKS